MSKEPTDIDEEFDILFAEEELSGRGGPLSSLIPSEVRNRFDWESGIRANEYLDAMNIEILDD